MMQCNYPTSSGVRCWYETTFDSERCYFHGKVEARLITGYYEHLTNEDSRTNRWVAL